MFIKPPNPKSSIRSHSLPLAPLIIIGSDITIDLTTAFSPTLPTQTPKSSSASDLHPESSENNGLLS